MRRAEMARRRKNLSEKRNEEEKVSPVSFMVAKQHHRGPLPHSFFSPFPHSYFVFLPNPFSILHSPNPPLIRAAVLMPPPAHSK